MVVSTNACPSCSLMASRCAPRWSRLVASECLLFRYRNRRHYAGFRTIPGVQGTELRLANQLRVLAILPDLPSGIVLT